MTVALYNIVNTSTGVIEYNINVAAANIAAAPTSAAVHPSLTCAAQALRVADHIAKTYLPTA
jgi:hypothetical protein